jgi:transposase-like protein
MLKCPKCHSLNLRLLVDHKKGGRGKEYHCAGCDSRLMEDASYRRTVPAQREQMVALRKEGLSQRGIARALNCSLTTVIYHLKKACIRQANLPTTRPTMPQRNLPTPNTR